MVDREGKEEGGKVVAVGDALGGRREEGAKGREDGEERLMHATGLQTDGVTCVCVCVGEGGG